MHIIEAQEISKYFNDFFAVKNLSFRVKKGECFALLGPNGAGKSTLISMLYGAIKCSQGKLRVLGLDPGFDSYKLKKKIGVVTQENCLDESLTVIENMKIYSEFLCLPKKEATREIIHLLKFMELYHKKDAHIERLSGGMKRRLVFVRALLNRPQLLILDEPTTGLDPAVRKIMWDKISYLKSQLNMTIILCTHYMDEAEQLADEIMIMDHGEFKAQDNPKRMIQKHCPGYIAFFKENSISKEILYKYTRSSTIFFCELHPYYQTLRYLSLDDLYDFSKNYKIQAQIVRPSNLEDVFLTLTGRTLSDDA